MNPYNRNDELVKIDESFINGYLTPLAMLRSFTTSEVGFNYYFKRLKNSNSVVESLSDEFRLSFKTHMDARKERYRTEEQFEELISKKLHLEEIENWEISLVDTFDFWTGKSITDTIKDENRVGAWEDKSNFFSLDLMEVLKLFFYPKTMKAYKYYGQIENDLTHHWGGLVWLDIIFSNQDENYLLHFHLTD